MQPSADVRGTMRRFYGQIANRCPGHRRARPAVLETHTKNPALWPGSSFVAGTREEELAASEQMMVASDPGAVSFITLRPD